MLRPASDRVQKNALLSAVLFYVLDKAFANRRVEVWFTVLRAENYMDPNSNVGHESHALG